MLWLQFQSALLLSAGKVLNHQRPSSTKRGSGSRVYAGLTCGATYPDHTLVFVFSYSSSCPNYICIRLLVLRIHPLPITKFTITCSIWTSFRGVCDGLTENWQLSVKTSIRQRILTDVTDVTEAHTSVIRQISVKWRILILDGEWYGTPIAVPCPHTWGDDSVSQLPNITSDFVTVLVIRAFFRIRGVFELMTKIKNLNVYITLWMSIYFEYHRIVYVTIWECQYNLCCTVAFGITFSPDVVWINVKPYPGTVEWRVCGMVELRDNEWRLHKLNYCNKPPRATKTLQLMYFYF